MAGNDDDARRDATARTQAVAAVELINAELTRADPNWRTVLVLAARLVEIADRAERGLEPNGEDH